MQTTFRTSRRPLTREFHVSREARRRYGVPETLVSLRGTVVVADLAAAQRLAAAVNRERDARRYPELAVTAGEIHAAGLIDELLHLLLDVYRESVDPDLDREAERSLVEAVGEGALDATLAAFVEAFPTADVAASRLTARDYLAGTTDGAPNRHVALEELLMLWLSNANPALERLLDLFDDRPLAQATDYPRVVEGLQRFLGGLGGVGPDGRATDVASGAETLLAMLRAPALASPTSLEGQLDYLRVRWGSALGGRFGAVVERMLRSLDVLREETKPSFGGPGPSEVIDPAAYSPGPGRQPEEYERFSVDSSWMPRVVLLAKSTYVWLDQLARRFRREVTRLDQIPDEAIDELAERGFTGLWLIGLWERSDASRRIKHLRGQPDAVASAYALYDYRIAEDLGGDAAYQDLRERAGRRGLRLASDMVPNHVGIDGRWVVEHPEWFLQLDHPPFPGYTFDGPDLSRDDRIGVFLEDHYYDSSDAAVVFKRLDRHTGEARYLYHGNDGTSMPWNDTAQLDYLNPDVREAVIQTILHVARQFPIIRFDAAMTLAKQHVQRLWYPEPGHGGAIPSRTQYGSMSAEELDRNMPEEFWREVVDRVAEEVPDTLLLAEAFWMMESYFVRTLGMHRVYNSAFMNMLKDEENAKYRQTVKNVLAFDPQILKRFVNFMNNPDEETAVAQFGRGDKYFGVTTLLVTMPGLPMFGHGQVEGYTEKYGMEYRRPKLDEYPDEGLVERHEREIFPLLHRRAQFAEVDEFLFYDLVGDDGSVDEDVFAYSNRAAGEASLVLVNNRFHTARGRLKTSVPYTDKAGGGVRSRDLAEGLGLQEGGFLVMREHVGDVETIHSSDEVRDGGLRVELDAFEHRVYLDVREVRDAPGTPYARLCRELAGRPVARVDDALRSMVLRPLHAAFSDLVDTPLGDADALASAFVSVLDEIEALGVAADAGSAGRFARAAASLVPLSADAPEAIRRDVGALSPLLLAAISLRALGGADDPDDLRLPTVFLSGSVIDEPSAHAEFWTDVTPLLLRFAPLAAGAEPLAEDAKGASDAVGPAADVAEPETADPDAADADDEDAEATDATFGAPPSAAALNARLLDDEAVRAYLGVNEYDGVRWYVGEAYALLRRALVATAALLRREAGEDAEALVGLHEALAAAEEASGFQLDALLDPAARRDVDAAADDAEGEGGADARESVASTADEASATSLDAGGTVDRLVDIPPAPSEAEIEGEPVEVEPPETEPAGRDES